MSNKIRSINAMRVIARNIRIKSNKIRLKLRRLQNNKSNS